MALALLLTDAVDGTGATATVTGTGGQVVTLYAQHLDDTRVTSRYRPVGSRTGDGLVSLPLAPGCWWVYAVVGSAVSLVQFVQTTDGQYDLPTRVRSAVVARIKLLTLPSIAGFPALDGRVFDQFKVRPDAALVTFPCVILTGTDGVSDSLANDTNETDLKGIPVLVTICDKSADKSPDAARWVGAWRHAIERAFHQQRLPGVPESVYCTLEMQPVAQVGEGEDFFAVRSAMLVRAWCRVGRGLGA
jgi:hypothetical protein